MSIDIEEDIRAGLAYIANAVRTEPPPITTITEDSARAGARRSATRWKASGTSPRHRSGRVTILRFATLGLIVIGVVGLVGIVSNRFDGPAEFGQLEVHHSRVEVTVEAQLVCDRPIDNTGKFTTLVIDSYSDRVGRQWASRTTYPDGSSHDYIAFDSTIYPTRLYERGKPLIGNLARIHVEGIDLDALDAFRQCPIRHADDAKLRLRQPRCCGAVRDRKPDFERRLGADLMHAKRGEEADHTLGNAQCDFGQRAVLGDLCARDAVQPAGKPFEPA